MDFRCKICKKDYSSYQSLWNHNKKYHSKENISCSINVQKHVQKCSNNVQLYSILKKSIMCEYCNKEFNNRSTKSMHKRSCIYKNKIIINNEEKQIQNKEQENTNIQINNNTNNTNTNNINNTNNGTINNNYIVIQPNGHEKIDDFSIHEIIKIINSGNNSVVKCTELLNFNKKRPQYHSFCNTSLEGDYFSVVDTKTQTTKKINKNDHINTVLTNSINFINKIHFLIENDDDFSSQFKKEDIKKITEIINNQHKFHEIKNKRAYMKIVNETSYNLRKLIKETWKLLKPIDNNDSDSDDYKIDIGIKSNSDYESSDED